MKIFTYLRTVWHTFWMYMLVGPAAKDLEVESLQQFKDKHSLASICPAWDKQFMRARHSIEEILEIDKRHKASKDACIH